MSEDDDIFLTQSKFMSPVKEDEEDDFVYRFAKPLSEDDIFKRMEICVPKGTVYKNDWAMGVFRRWQEERSHRPIEDNLEIPMYVLKENFLDMEAAALNIALKYFIFEAMKANGDLYPSITVYGMFTALASALKASGSKYKLMDDDEFSDCRKALDAVMRERSAAGLGADCRRQTEVITREDEGILWEKGGLGDSSPQQLLDTVLYLTGLHFALRGGKEHRALRLHVNPQITGPHVDQNGRRYLQYVEDVSKTNPGGIKSRKVERKKVRAYENKENPDRCYLKIYEKYRSLCPPSSTRANAFYFAALKKPKNGKWFMDPVGHNTLQTTVKRMCEMAGVPGRKTNHSLRSTAATRLYEAQFSEQQICEHTDIVESWIVEIVEVSSRESECNPSNMIGQPDGQLWAPSYWSQEDFAEVRFSSEMYIEQIDIYQRETAGGVRRISLLTPGGAWYAVWSTDQLGLVIGGRMSPDLELTHFKASIARIHTGGKSYYEYIDAVRIRGRRQRLSKRVYAP